jgi:hypothetical protein
MGSNYVLIEARSVLKLSEPPFQHPSANLHRYTQVQRILEINGYFNSSTTWGIIFN